MTVKRRVFYGWIVVAAGAAVMGVAIGIINNCFGLLIVPVCDEFGFSRRDMAFNQTMLNLAAMLVAMLSGVLFAKGRLKGLMRAGTVIMCLAYALFPLARSLWAFYLIALVVGLAQGMVNVVPFSIIVGNWFVKKRGMALGITYMGSGVGGMLFNALGGRMIEAFGWRATVFAFDAIIFAVAVPMVFFVIRAEPSEMGLTALGSEDDKTDVSPRSVGPRTHVHPGAFGVIALDIVITGVAVGAIAATSTPYYTDIFSSGVVGANMASGFMASLAVGKLLLGSLYDRIGTLRATLFSRVLLLSAMLALAGGKGWAFIALFVVCSGTAAASNSISIPFLARVASGNRDSVRTVGVFSGLQSLGALLAPVICGWFCDRTGSYADSYKLCFVLVLVVMPVLTWILARNQRYAQIENEK